MADLKFHCPECRQRLSVDESASGAQIECPHCRCALVIPSASGDAVKVVTRRGMAVLAGSSGSAYEELERKQRELSSALDEAAALRAESERSKSELNRLRQDLAAAANRVFAPTGVSESERALRENEQLRAKVAEVEAARHLLATRMAALDEAKPALPPAVDGKDKPEIEKLRHDFARIQETLSSVTAERDRWKVESVRATEALRDFDTAKASLLRGESRIDELTGGEAALRRECEELRAQVTRMQTQAGESAKACRELEAEVEALQRRLVSTGADHEAALRQLAEQREALSNLTGGNSTALQQAEAARTQIIQLTDEIHARSAERDHACQALADRDLSLRAASVTIDAAKKEMARLKHDVAESGNEQAHLRDQLAESTEEAKELQHRVDSLLDALHGREREVAESRELLMTTTGERETARQKLAEKEDELREANARLETTHRYAESKVLETQQDAESKVESAQREAEARVANAQRTIDELLAARQELEARLATSEAMVADGTARFEALRQASDSEREASIREREDLRGRVEQLIGDLHARESELAAARHTVSANDAAQGGLQTQLGARSEEILRLAGELEAARRELTEQQELAREDALRAQREAEAKLENVRRDQAIKLDAQDAEAAQSARAAEENRQRLERELGESNKHADVLEGRCASLQSDLQRVQGGLEQIRTELRSAQQGEARAADELVEKEKQIAALHERVSIVQESEKSIRGRAAQMEEDLRQRLDGAVKALEEGRGVAAERDQLAEELERARAELLAFQETVRGARQERDAIRINLNSMELQIEESLDQIHAGEAERDALKAELEAVRAGLERAKQHVNVLQSRRDQMREEIARLKVQLGQSPDAAP